jgi:hypothetical protein
LAIEHPRAIWVDWRRDLLVVAANVNRTEHRTSLQEQIAALAARRMAEDGEEPDRAKHKAAAALLGDAARTHGVLPDGDQLRAALREYLRCHGGEEHWAWLRRQRLLALEWMQRLERFEPHLVGPVLDASATRMAPVELNLYADSAKDVEMVLLDLGIAFRVDQPDNRRRHVQQLIGFVAYCPNESAPTPGRTRPGTLRGTPILLTVNDPLALRIGPGARKASADPMLHPVECAGRADAIMLRQLLEDTDRPGATVPRGD